MTHPAPALLAVLAGAIALLLLPTGRAGADSAGRAGGADATAVVAARARIESALDEFSAGHPRRALANLASADRLLRAVDCAGHRERVDVALWRAGVLLGRDRAAAERAIRDALAADPALVVDLGRFWPSLADAVERVRAGTAMIEVRLLGAPPGAEICAAGRAITDARFRTLAGRHRIAVRAPGHRPRAIERSLDSDVAIDAALAPLAAATARPLALRAEAIVFASRRRSLAQGPRQLVTAQHGVGVELAAARSFRGDALFVGSHLRALRFGDAAVKDAVEMPGVEDATGNRGWVVDWQARAGARLTVGGGRVAASAYVALDLASDRAGDLTAASGDLGLLAPSTRLSLGGGAAAELRLSRGVALAVDSTYSAVGSYLESTDAAGTAPTSAAGTLAARWAASPRWQLAAAVHFDWLAVDRASSSVAPISQRDDTTAVALSAAHSW